MISSWRKIARIGDKSSVCASGGSDSGCANRHCSGKDYSHR